MGRKEPKTSMVFKDLEIQSTAPLKEVRDVFFEALKKLDLEKRRGYIG